MKSSNISSISWLRATAVIFILLCHLVVQFPNSYIVMLGQFFNVGVHIFILISGFLFGIKGISDSKSWIIKRFKRIFIPFWVFLIILFIVTNVTNTPISAMNWILLVFGMQGSSVGVLGAEQTWYISTILLCYLLTPLLANIVQKVKEENRIKNIIYLILLILPIVFACFDSPAVYTLLSPITLYVFGFILGDKYEHMQKRNSIIYMLGLLLMFAIRIGSKILFDDTILYDRIIVFYTQSGIAIFLLLLFFNLFQSRKANRLVDYINKYSYEIYLVHYMFIVGPISLMHITSNWFLNSSIVILISFIVAMVVQKISDLIVKKIIQVS